MNPTNKTLLDIVSLRIKNIHYTIKDAENAEGHVALAPTEFDSINKAKAHSLKLGGAGKVRAFKSKDQAFDFLRAYEKAKKDEVQ